MVSRLQMKLKDKIGVGAIFALGFFVVIASSMQPPLVPHMCMRPEADIVTSYPGLLLEEERNDADLHGLDGRNCHRHYRNLLARSSLNDPWN